MHGVAFIGYLLILLAVSQESTTLVSRRFFIFARWFDSGIGHGNKG